MTREVLVRDCSAVSKLVVAEPESTALAERLTGQALVASAPVVPAASRAVRRTVGRSHDVTLAEVLELTGSCRPRTRRGSPSSGRPETNAAQRRSRMRTRDATNFPAPNVRPRGGCG